MGHAKMSVTVPEEVLYEIKEIAAKKRAKLSKLVTEALVDKIRKSKEEAFIAEINRVFQDRDAVEEQRTMAEEIADSTNVGELPW